MEKLLEEDHAKDVLRRGYAKTIEEWWFLLRHESGLPLFRGPILEKYLSPDQMRDFDTAMSEKAAAVVHRLLDDAWYKLPDERWIRDLPGFGRLCDLCSDFPGEPVLKGEEDE